VFLSPWGSWKSRKNLKEMQSAAHTNSGAYKDRTVEDNEGEAELQEQEEATVRSQTGDFCRV
jgi:hypothetical protein